MRERTRVLANVTSTQDDLAHAAAAYADAHAAGVLVALRDARAPRQCIRQGHARRHPLELENALERRTTRPTRTIPGLPGSFSGSVLVCSLLCFVGLGFGGSLLSLGLLGGDIALRRHLVLFRSREKHRTFLVA